MRRWLGLCEFIHDAIDDTVQLVEETQREALHRPLSLLSKIEALSPAARTVEDAHRLGAGLVFEGIRGTNHAVRAVSELAVGVVARVGEIASEREPEPVRKTASAAARIADVAESALNGVCGDLLRKRDNGLSIEMTLRLGGRDLSATAEALARALPDAKSKVCLFIHGLACSDTIWWRGRPETEGPASFGEELERELGFTALYLRYNSGLHISENGRALARLLEALVAHYPCKLEQLVLIGHSMGGLVARSAAHYGKALEQGWPERLTHLLCIGSPHFGAPLERIGHTVATILGAIGSAGARVPAKILAARSAGIRDLHSGSLLDEDWQDADASAFWSERAQTVPFLERVTYGYIAAHYHGSDSRLREWVGDLLVQLPSAAGRHQDARRHLPFQLGHVLEGVHHGALTTHPDVGRQLMRFLSLTGDPG